MFVVPFTRQETDPNENYNVKTVTEFILDWRIQVLNLAYKEVCFLRNTFWIQTFQFRIPYVVSLKDFFLLPMVLTCKYFSFTLFPSFNYETDYRLLELKICKESDCTVVWEPTDIDQFWPEEFEADAGEGWILTSTMITFVEQDTASSTLSFEL